MSSKKTQVFTAEQYSSRNFYIYEQRVVKKHLVFCIFRENFESDKEFLNFVNFTLESLNKNI